MEDYTVKTHDLFLLMLNLSQTSNSERAKDLFIESLEEVWPTVKFMFSDEQVNHLTVDVKTISNTFGFIKISDKYDRLSSKDLSLIRNATSWLALILENISRQNYIKGQNTRLEKLVEERARAHKKAQMIAEKAETSLKRMNTVLDALTIGFWVYDVKSGTLEFDDIMYKLYGISSEIYPNPLDIVDSLVHPSEKNKIPPGILERAQHGESFFNFEIHITTPDEASRCLLSKIIVKRNSKGAPVKIFGTDEFKVVQPNKLNSRWPKIIALGGSAGAAEAMLQFFRSCPWSQNSGLTFVIESHYSAYGLLGSKIPSIPNLSIILLKKDTRPSENIVYVSGKDHFIIIENGWLKLRNRRKELIVDTVDRLFVSLSESEKQDSVAIVFSGMLNDGAAGIVAVKKAGGLTIVQDPDTAVNPGMPQAAIDSGSVDFALPAGKIPAIFVEKIHKTDLHYEALDQKLKNITFAHGNLKNFFNFVEVHMLSSILILDHDLQIKNFCGPVDQVLPVMEFDIGRPVTDLNLNLDYINFELDIREVLQTARTIETQKNTWDGRKYLVRINLYKEAGRSESEGIVTFVPLEVKENRAAV